MRRLAWLLLAFVLACVSVKVEREDATIHVRSFGASTTIVEPDGSVQTDSEGLSEGFVNTVGRAVSAVRDFALAFFGRPVPSTEES